MALPGHEMKTAADNFRETFSAYQAEVLGIDFEELQAARQPESWLPEREMIVVSTAIAFPELVFQAVCQPRDFLDRDLGDLWKTIQHLSATRGAGWTFADIDDLLTDQSLKQLLYEAVIRDSYPRSFAGLARYVRDHGHERRLKESMVELAMGDYRGAEFTDMASKLASSIGAGQQTEGLILQDSLPKMLDEILCGELAKELYLPTGLADLEDLVGGLPLGVMSVVGARPSVGKSSLLATIARNVALRGEHVDFYSLEDSFTSLRRRIIAQESGINSRQLADGSLDYEQREGIKAAMKRLYESGGSILISDRLPPSPLEFTATMRANAEARRTKLIVIDYVQLLHDETRRYGSRNEEISRISAALCAVAKETGAALLVASQLKRLEDEEEPELSDLRDSGSLEQDAFLVGMLWRPARIDFEIGDKPCLLKVAKNKDGRIGLLTLLWRPESVYFGNASPALRERVVSAMVERRAPGRKRLPPPQRHWQDDSSRPDDTVPAEKWKEVIL